MSKKRGRDDEPGGFTVKLCSSVSRGEQCQYGDTCRFGHDVAGYMAQKLPDLGSSCFLFEKYGKCPYGLSCRFGSSHIDLNTMACIVKPDWIEMEPEINVLSKHLQTLLRKRKYIPSRKQEDKAVSLADQKTPTDEDPESMSSGPVAGRAEEAAGSPSTARKQSGNGDVAINHKREFDPTPYPLKEVKLVDFSNKVYIAPLTTVGNLPFRRVMKDFGADITCGEMALGFNLHQGQSSEWALLRRHSSEDVFGMQICGSKPDMMRDVARILNNETQSDFIDLNCGCPIDVVCNRGAGSALMTQPKKLCNVVSQMVSQLDRSVTVKIRTGWDDKSPTAHMLIPEIQKISQGKIAAIMIHGRSRLQRYTRLANWEYILQAARSQDPTLDRIPVIGNGDIFSYEDWRDRQSKLQENMDGDEFGLCSCAMIGRGALVKPWLPREIKESKGIDISASERLEMLKNFVNYGLEHWGSDTKGVSTTRRFLLEWLSYLCRYVPYALLENPPQKINIRPNTYVGRSDLESLLGSSNPEDWIRISEMLLGPVPEGFTFTPKHQSNSYSVEPRATESSSAVSHSVPAPIGDVIEETVDGADNVEG